MSLANIVSAYVAFELADEEIGQLLRKYFEKERPGVIYGHPEWKKFLVPRNEEALIEKFLESNGYDRDPFIDKHKFFTTKPVFLERQIPTEDRKGFVRNLGCEIVYDCEVCHKPMFGGAHKHILKFCEKCDKKTVHTTPFFGHPFRCREH